MQSLYISKIAIKNYRNFKDVVVNLGHKQVIIGENNIGKTNFLKALQLILDPSLSDEDRMLNESDFMPLWPHQVYTASFCNLKARGDGIFAIQGKIIVWQK